MSTVPMRFATAEQPVLGLDRAGVHFDGIFSEPRLAHPECVAIGPDGRTVVGNLFFNVGSVLDPQPHLWRCR